METRKHYTKEFKLGAVSLVVDQGLTIIESAIYCYQTGSSLSQRYHLHLDTGRLAVSGNRNRPVFQKSGRLEHELTDDSNTGL